MNLFCEHSELYWETFPTSGSMRNGQLFPRLRSVPPISENEFSSQRGLLGTPRSAHGMNDDLDSVKSRTTRDRATLEQDVALLPTPNGGNFNDGEDAESWEARRQANLAKGINGNGQGTPLSMAVQMLPTPNTRDWKGSPGAGSRARGGHQASLPAAILPTPQARDWKGSSQTQQRDDRPGRIRGPGDKDLAEAVESIGGSTPLPLPAGSLCSVDPLPGQLSLLDEMEGSDFLPSSSSGSWGSRKGGSQGYRI
jgi:hypothetical protein